MQCIDLTHARPCKSADLLCSFTSLPCSPSGTFLPDDTAACELCPEDTYRAGDATPENNVCKPVPAGAHWVGLVATLLLVGKM